MQSLANLSRGFSDNSELPNPLCSELLTMIYHQTENLTYQAIKVDEIELISLSGEPPGSSRKEVLRLPPRTLMKRSKRRVDRQH